MTSKVLSKSGSLRTGSLAKISFNLLKARSRISVQAKISSLWVNSVKGPVMNAYSLTNIRHHPVNPKIPLTLETLQGIGHLTTAATLSGSGEIPSLDTMNPK